MKTEISMILFMSIVAAFIAEQHVNNESLDQTTTQLQ